MIKSMNPARLLACIAAVAALMTMPAYATLDTDSPAENSMPSSVSESARENEETLSAQNETASAAEQERVTQSDNPSSVNEPAQNGIQPYGTETNPDTGAESMVLPGLVALISASVAAIAISGKKTGK